MSSCSAVLHMALGCNAVTHCFVLRCLRMSLVQVSCSEHLMGAYWWEQTWRVCQRLECLLQETAARKYMGLKLCSWPAECACGL
jgi:hypothetical protein